jgi:hypothetical protein
VKQLTRFEWFPEGDSPKGDPLDRLTVIIMLMIIWRLIGGC